MTFFAFSVDATEQTKKYVEETHQRLTKVDMIKNPFTGGVKLVSSDGQSDTYICVIEPIYPRLYFLGLLLLVGAAFFIKRWWSWFYLPGIFLTMQAFLWSRYFYIIMIRQGFKKNGYNGPFKVIDNNMIVNELVQKWL
jgi:hypothetical protein